MTLHSNPRSLYCSGFVGTKYSENSGDVCNDLAEVGETEWVTSLHIHRYKTKQNTYICTGIYIYIYEHITYMYVSYIYIYTYYIYAYTSRHTCIDVLYI